ncbi:MAG TPA: hypothetical protein VMV04_19550 [Thermodesulfobacteriota bacterium]|jgi:hypothetical protein|nr:hypothetical protein [Thermodesulfobacteriota bacterium]
MDSKQEEISQLTALLKGRLTSEIGVNYKKPSHSDAEFACLRQAGIAD